MRILYGVSGEGFGHSSRAKVIIKYLHDSGHEVLVMTYGQAYDILKQDFRVYKIGGIIPQYREGRLSLIKSIVSNVPVVRKTLRNYWKTKKLIDEFDPELCITDMEPTVPISSYKRKLPLISIDNQHSITNFKFEPPKKYKMAYRVVKTAVHRCVPKANSFIVLSFFRARTKIKNTFIVSPILRKEIIKAKPKTGKKILVYLSKGDDRLLGILKKIPEEFIIYGYNKISKSGNFEFKKSGSHFLDDLINCRCIIASSGFSLISEALYLKKPYFAIPLKRQFEQYENAVFLNRAGFGEFSEKPTKIEIEKFLLNLSKYKKKLKTHKIYSDKIKKVLDKIISKIDKRGKR